MGQYQQWLHYREIDHALQAQLETLEQRLAHIQERARVLAQSLQPQCEDASAQISQPPEQVLIQPGSQIIPALLISMNAQLTSNEQAAEQSTSPQSLPPIPHSDMTLLAEDMGTFIDQHAQTDPQLELPHWLRNIASAAATQHPDSPIDQESIRTNRLVQRWVERWGRQDARHQKPGESLS